MQSVHEQTENVQIYRLYVKKGIITQNILYVKYRGERQPRTGGITVNITQLRNEMIKVGLALGLSHPWTVALSQELDKLMNEAQEKGMAI